MNWYKTAAMSEEAICRLDNGGCELVSEKKYNGYELFLTKFNVRGSEMITVINETIGFEIPFYQLAIQREGEDCTNISTQYSKRPPTVEQFQKTKIKETLSWIKETILSWVGEYGSIFISSHSGEKVNRYKSILSKLEISFKEIEVDNEMISFKGLIIG